MMKEENNEAAVPGQSAISLYVGELTGLVNGQRKHHPEHEHYQQQQQHYNPEESETFELDHGDDAKHDVATTTKDNNGRSVAEKNFSSNTNTTRSSTTNDEDDHDDLDQGQVVAVVAPKHHHHHHHHHHSDESLSQQTASSVTAGAAVEFGPQLPRMLQMANKINAAAAAAATQRTKQRSHNEDDDASVSSSSSSSSSDSSPSSSSSNAAERREKGDKITPLVDNEAFHDMELGVPACAAEADAVTYDTVETVSPSDEVTIQLSLSSSHKRTASSSSIQKSLSQRTASASSVTAGAAVEFGPQLPRMLQMASKINAAAAAPQRLNKQRIKQVSHNKRISFATDIETCNGRPTRAHQVKVRKDAFSDPGMKGERKMYEVLKAMKLGSFYAKHIAGEDDGDCSNSRNDESISTSMRGRLAVSHRTIPVRRRDSNDGDDDDYSYDDTKYYTGSTRENPHYEQYRLQAVKPKGNLTGIWKILSCFTKRGYSIYDDSNTSSASNTCLGVNLNHSVVQYLHWTHRSSFAEVLVSAAIGFFTLTTLFGLFIWGIGNRHPTCIGGPDFDRSSFIDSFELSWTTFSTVGYGLVYTGLSTDEPDIKKCTGITLLVSLESYIGILYSALCSAIFFAKFARVQSHAQVQFSSPIVIRYGTGMMEAADDDEEAAQEIQIPCPILEFRIVNLMSSTPGGEIIDSALNIVVSVDPEQALAAMGAGGQRRRKGKKKKGGAKRVNAVRQRPPGTGLNDTNGLQGGDGLVPPMPPPNSIASGITTKRRISFTSMDDQSEEGINFFTRGPSYKRQKAFEEDPTGHLVPKRFFAKLEVETPDHPFFKRVWLVQHRLDEQSPLLRGFARQMLVQNNGFWPRDLNSHEGVRSAILFDQILVSLSGTSNADANSVYAQHVYDFVDVNVGYQFVQVLYREGGDGALCVDHRLVNDVIEQVGGGGEPLFQYGGDDTSVELIMM